MAYRRRINRAVRRGVKYAGKRLLAAGLGRMLSTKRNLKRKGPSYTKTTKKRKLNKPKRIGGHSWAGYASWGRYKAAPKTVSSNHSLNNYVRQLAERVAAATPGRQGINDDYKSNIFTLGGLQELTGHGDAADQAARKTFIKGGQLKILGTNSSNTNMRITAYNICARRNLDVGVTPFTDWGIEQSMQGLSEVTPYMMGNTPYSSRIFTQHWNIWKTTNYYLSAGESFVHTTNVNVNKFVDFTEVWREARGLSATKSGAIKGVTQYVILVVQGFPAHETTVQTNVTTARVSFDAVYLSKCQWYQSDIDYQATTYSAQLLNTSPASNLVQVIDETATELTIFD